MSTTPGVVVGVYERGGANHGFIDRHGQFTTLDVPGALATTLVGINDAGVIAGFYQDSHKVFHGFIDCHGHLAAVNDPHAGTAALEGTFAQYMNNHGVLVGYYIDAHGVQHGFIGRGVRLKTINHGHAGTKKGQGTLLASVNDHGVLTGQYFTRRGTVSFTGRPGAFTPVTDPAAAPFSTFAGTISNSGLIAGNYIDPRGVAHGFYNRGKMFTTINDPHASTKQGEGTFLQGSSNMGVGTGWYIDSHGNVHGFTFTPAR